MPTSGMHFDEPPKTPAPPKITLRHLHVVERLIYLKGSCPCCNAPTRRRIVDFGLPLDTPLDEVRLRWECASATASPLNKWEPDLTKRRAKKGDLASALKQGYTRIEAWCHDLKCHHHKTLEIAELTVPLTTRLDELEVRFFCSKCGGIDIGVSPDSSSLPPHKAMPDLTWRWPKQR